MVKSYSNMDTLNSIISTSFMSSPSSYTPNVRIVCSRFESHCLSSRFPYVYIMGFDIKINHQRIQTTHSHASRCHHCSYCQQCNLDFVVFHNVTCYYNPRLSHIHVNTTKLLKITCTLVATSVILQSLECNFER